MRLCLVTMPWQSLDTPSLPLGLLSAVIRQGRPQDDLRVEYANIRWAEEVLDRTDGEITPDDYSDLVEDGLFHGVGDWVFTSSLYGDAAWPVERYFSHPATAARHDGAARRMRELAADFVRSTAEEILGGNPDVVGLTSTFMQNVPSLALAAELKRRDPDVSVVLGGGNCDGSMGPALHRNFPALDYVVSGEGEQAFLALVDALDRGADPQALAGIGGLCWRHEGENVVNDAPSEPLTMDDVPMPIFDDYFAAIESSTVREYLEPKLVHEAARGCWWGMLKHCTFCGLNGSTMVFRSKSPERVWAEIDEHVRRHEVLDVVMVDNIMDMHYIGTLLPQLAATDWDLRLHYEVKSNMRWEHVRALRDAGVVQIQPGIESLSARVLKIMDKGVDGVTNVRLLRDCEELGITTPWNYLFGFPGEDPGDYRPIIAQFPNLHHLQPPRVATRIALERFSPYHQRPELGFALRRPASFYRHVYDLPERELMDLVFIFECLDAGIDAEVERELIDAVALWQTAYFTSTLTFEDLGDELLITDQRSEREHREHRFHEPWHVAGYRLLAHGHGSTSLAKALGHLDIPFPGDAALEEWDRWLTTQGLVFTDNGRSVALATRQVPAKVPGAEWR
jgi:ribosomal peptide maturation radical SAM protein 1